MKGIDKSQEATFNYLKNVVFYLKQLQGVNKNFPIIKGKNDQNIDLCIWQKAWEENGVLNTKIEKNSENNVDILVLVE